MILFCALKIELGYIKNPWKLPSLDKEGKQDWKFEMRPISNYSKSQIFVQKFNFIQVFFNNFSREIKVVNS